MRYLSKWISFVISNPQWSPYEFDHIPHWNLYYEFSLMHINSWTPVFTERMINHSTLPVIRLDHEGIGSLSAWNHSYSSNGLLLRCSTVFLCHLFIFLTIASKFQCYFLSLCQLFSCAHSLMYRAREHSFISGFFFQN